MQCSRWKRKRGDEVKGEYMVNISEVIFGINQTASPASMRLRMGQNMLLECRPPRLINRKLLSLNVLNQVFSGVVYGGVRAHARSAISFYFPRLNAPSWFRS